MKIYKHIFFDLDRTLWDFETNSTTALLELYHYHQLEIKGINSFDDFVRKYLQVNNRLWKHYQRGNIDKAALRINRFHKTFLSFGVDDYYLAVVFGEHYIKTAPLKTAVFPYTHEALSYLKTKYELHIITNGFEEVQHVKLNACELRPYFKHIITSESAGAQKPQAEIFNFALTKAVAKPEECLMVGDHYEADIVGAKKAGIDQVYFTPTPVSERRIKATYQIVSLAALKEIL